jgi:HlyD family secretion protein
MNATVDINTNTKRNVVTVPIESVTSRTDTTSGKQRSATEKLLGEKADDKEAKPITCVFVVEDGRAVVRAVESGIQDDQYIEIMKGLEAGETIVSGPYDIVSERLMPGDKVTVVSKDELYKKE